MTILRVHVSLLTLVALFPVLAAPQTLVDSDCHTYVPGISAPAKTSSGVYHAILTCGAGSTCEPNAGVITSYHPDSYFHVSPTSASNGMQDREGWLAQNQLHQPITLPFRDTSVVVHNGWNYDAARRHTGLDYARTAGGTFTVNAVADGVVIWKGYMTSPGNVVMIEHTAPDGTRFRSIYHHLMNGRDHDVGMARATLPFCSRYNWSFCSGPEYAQLTDRYVRDADFAFANPNDASVAARWGTNSDYIRVNVGDAVQAGQVIGSAGATGVHQTGIHLHIMFAREATHMQDGSAVTRWTFFDPYGLYALNSACYTNAFSDYPSGNPAHAFQHKAVHAPFPQEFAGIEAPKFQRGFDYYAAIGWFPEALGTSMVPNTWHLAGSFQPDPLRPVSRGFRTFADHQSDFDYWIARGWRPHQMSVVAPGIARYTTLYAPVAGSVWTSHKMTAGYFAQRFGELYSSHILVDAVPYVENGVLYFAATWEQAAHSGYAMYFQMTESDFWSRHSTFTSQGADVLQVHAYDHPGLGKRYAALWRTIPGTTQPFLNRTPAQFVEESVLMRLGGWRVRHTSTRGNEVHTVWASQ